MCIQCSEGFRATLTLTNHRSAELASEGWELYFNFRRIRRTRTKPRLSVMWNIVP